MAERPTAAKIMIVRHAEKPPPTGAPHGVTLDGKQDGDSLTVRGWQRAGALVALFAPAAHTLPSPHLATPRVLYAAGARSGRSRRSEETLAPLAAYLGVEVHTPYTKGEEGALAAGIVAHAGPVLVAWAHEYIPAIVDALPLAARAHVPTRWPDARFDVVWVFDLDAAAGTYRFTQVPQRLLAGDTPDPIR